MKPMAKVRKEIIQEAIRAELEKGTISEGPIGNIASSVANMGVFDMPARVVGALGNTFSNMGGQMRLGSVGKQLKRTASRIENEWDKAEEIASKIADKMQSSKNPRVSSMGKQISSNIASADNDMRSAINRIENVANVTGDSSSDQYNTGDDFDEDLQVLTKKDRHGTSYLETPVDRFIKRFGGSGNLGTVQRSHLERVFMELVSNGINPFKIDRDKIGKLQSYSEFRNRQIAETGIDPFPNNEHFIKVLGREKAAQLGKIPPKLQRQASRYMQRNGMFSTDIDDIDDADDVDDVEEIDEFENSDENESMSSAMPNQKQIMQMMQALTAKNKKTGGTQKKPTEAQLQQMEKWLEKIMQNKTQSQSFSQALPQASANQTGTTAPNAGAVKATPPPIPPQAPKNNAATQQASKPSQTSQGSQNQPAANVGSATNQQPNIKNYTPELVKLINDLANLGVQKGVNSQMISKWVGHMLNQKKDELPVKNDEDEKLVDYFIKKAGEAGFGSRVNSFGGNLFDDNEPIPLTNQKNKNPQTISQPKASWSSNTPPLGNALAQQMAQAQAVKVAPIKKTQTASWNTTTPPLGNALAQQLAQAQAVKVAPIKAVGTPPTPPEKDRQIELPTLSNDDIQMPQLTDFFNMKSEPMDPAKLPVPEIEKKEEGSSQPKKKPTARRKNSTEKEPTAGRKNSTEKEPGKLAQKELEKPIEKEPEISTKKNKRPSARMRLPIPKLDKSSEVSTAPTTPASLPVYDNGSEIQVGNVKQPAFEMAPPKEDGEASKKKKVSARRKK